MLIVLLVLDLTPYLELTDNPYVLVADMYMIGWGERGGLEVEEVVVCVG